MTSEIRTTVELSDIKTIEIECQNCKARIARPISSWKSDVFGCGNCNASWMVPHTPDYEKLKQLVRSLEAYSSPPSEGQPYRIRLEVAGVTP